MRDFIELLDNLPPQMAGAFMAIFISILRVIYDNKETRPLRMILECLICGSLSLSAGYAIIALGLNMNWILFLGGVIGYLGSTTVRAIAMKLINSKIK